MYLLFGPYIHYSHYIVTTTTTTTMDELFFSPKITHIV